jgi:hypothetical protein
LIGIILIKSLSQNYLQQIIGTLNNDSQIIMITPMTNIDKEKLKSRSINEHSFSWMTQYRRLTCRYEKYTNTFTNFIYLAFCNITLNKIQQLKK